MVVHHRSDDGMVMYHRWSLHFCFCIQMSGPLEQQKRRSQYQMCNDYNCVASSPVEKRFDVHPGPRRHPLTSPSSDNADRLSPHTAQQSKPLHLGRVALCRKESRCLAINQIGTFQPCDSVQCKWTIERSERSSGYDAVSASVIIWVPRC